MLIAFAACFALYNKFLCLFHFMQTIDKLREKVLFIIGDCKG